jgi:hypothetical protein
MSAANLKGKFEQAIKDAAPKKVKKEKVWTPNQGGDGHGAHSTNG